MGTRGVNNTDAMRRRGFPNGKRVLRVAWAPPNWSEVAGVMSTFRHVPPGDRSTSDRGVPKRLRRHTTLRYPRQRKYERRPRGRSHYRLNWGNLVPMVQRDQSSPREVFKDDFNLADTVFAYGERLPEQTRSIEAQAAGTTQVVAFVAVAAYAKVLRQLHGTIRLCEVGLSQEALVLNRVGLEALLLLRWVLLPDVVLTQGGKAVQRPPMPEPGADFRARLYCAHVALAWMRALHKNGKRVFDNVSDAAHEQARANAEAAREDIGRDWADLLEDRPFTYSTLNTRELAASVGYLSEYGRIRNSCG